MSAATDQFTEDATLTAIAIGYRNEDYDLIADDVLPRAPVSDEKFEWTKYDEAAAFTVPDTKVGRRSTPNQVEIEGSKVNDATDDYGIDIPLDNATINAGKKNGFDPRKQATELATDIVMLDRERRVAELVQDPNTYHSSLVEALSGSDMFSDEASNPLTILRNMLKRCWMRPNQLTFGTNAWDAFASHPKVVSAVLRNSGQSGFITQEEAARVLRVKRIIVGEGRINVNKPGEEAELHRVWDNTVSGQFINRAANSVGGVTFGYTAVFGKKIAGTLPANFGIRGGLYVRSAESVKEVKCANRAGFLLQNAVAPDQA